MDSPVSDSAIVIKATTIPSKYKPKQLTEEYPIHNQSIEVVEEYIHLYDCFSLLIWIICRCDCNLL